MDKKYSNLQIKSTQIGEEIFINGIKLTQCLSLGNFQVFTLEPRIEGEVGIVGVVGNCIFTHCGSM